MKHSECFWFVTILFSWMKAGYIYITVIPLFLCARSDDQVRGSGSRINGLSRVRIPEVILQRKYFTSKITISSKFIMEHYVGYPT